MCSHLYSSTSQTRRHSIHSKETQEKTPSQTRGSGWTSWVFMTRDLGDRMGPARPLQVTCTVEVPRWLASSLRHSPPLRASTLDHRTQPSRLGAQREGTRSSNTTEQQQSPDQKSSTSAQKTTTNQRHEAPPKTHTHEKTTTRRKAPRRSTKPPKDHEDETTKRPPKTKPPKDEEHHDDPRSHQKTTKPPKDKTSTWRPMRPFITQVPTLHSSPFSAPPPFQLL